MGNNNQSKALTDFLSLTGGELVGKVSGFIAFTYLARSLSPEDYGGVELAFGLLALFAIVVDFGFGPIGAKAIANSKNNATAISEEILSSRILLAIGSIPVMIFIGATLDLSDSAKFLIIIMSFSLLFTACHQKWIPQGLEKMNLVSASQALKMSVFMVCIVLLVENEEQIYAIGLIEILACAVTGLYFLAIQKKHLNTVSIVSSFGRIRSLFGQARFIGGSIMVWSLTQNIPIIALAVLVGPIEVAWYGAASRIANALSSFSMVYHFNMYPTVAERLTTSGDAYTEFSEPSMKITAWGGIFVAFLFTVIAEPICTFVFGSEYASASVTLTILIWIIPITILSAHARWLLIAANKQHLSMIARSAGCAACLFFTLILAPYFKAPGAAVAMITAFLIVWLLEHIMAARHVVGIPIRPVIMPLSISMIWLIVSYFLELSSAKSIFLLITGFVLSALIFDRKLYTDIPKLIKIKSFSNA